MHHVPVPLPGADPGACRISVWAKAGEGQLLRRPADGSRIGEAAVSLIGDGDGYHGVPDDLYFGSAQPAPAGGETPEEVVVVRKNARMHITVRGLDAGLPEERYYLTVRLPDDGYDYEGNPAGGTATIRRSGVFDDRGDLTTGAAFNVLHSGTVAEAVTVTLSERAAGRAVINEQLERMLLDYGNSVLRLAYSYLHNMPDAEEVLQDTLIQFLKTEPVLATKEDVYKRQPDTGLMRFVSVRYSQENNSKRTSKTARLNGKFNQAVSCFLNSLSAAESRGGKGLCGEELSVRDCRKEHWPKKIAVPEAGTSKREIWPGAWAQHPSA